MSQPEEEVANNNVMEEGDYDDDLEELGLFHTSSLRETADPPLEIQARETWTLEVKFGEDNQKFYNKYKVVKTLGRGAFGEVDQVEDYDGQQYAMKINSINGLQKQRFFAPDGQFATNLDILKNQLNILKRLKHPNIARCFEVIYGDKMICTINEWGNLGQIMNWSEIEEKYVRNENVVKYINQKYQAGGNLGKIAKIIFLQMSRAVKYLHDLDITNRDIKVDNIVIKQTIEAFRDVKLIDFTTVRFKKNDDISFFATGTPGFRGPEHQACSDGYSCKATDIWALAIAIWTFYHQAIPFPGENDYERDLKAQTDELTFDNSCPAQLVDAIKAMTHKDYRQRINIDQVIEILEKQQ